MKKALPEPPLVDAYWVIPQQFMAGEYPGGRYFEEETRRRLRWLLALHINVFIDLTEPGDRVPYAELLLDEANGYGQQVEYLNYPIPDFDTPSRRQMLDILEKIDLKLAENKTVYVHCWAGIGRTGTVVGCFLVRRGLTGEQALQKIADLRRDLPYSRVKSPENQQQVDMVLGWKE